MKRLIGATAVIEILHKKEDLRLLVTTRTVYGIMTFPVQNNHYGPYYTAQEVPFFLSVRKSTYRKPENCWCALAPEAMLSQGSV